MSLFGIQTLDEALAAIKKCTGKKPDEELVLGYGFNQVSNGGWSTKEDLDSVVSDRPACILDFAIHDVWMNSKAFEAG